MKQLVGEKSIENDCFPRTLKFEMTGLFWHFLYFLITSTILWRTSIVESVYRRECLSWRASIVESVYCGELLLWKASIMESFYCGERLFWRASIVESVVWPVIHQLRMVNFQLLSFQLFPDNLASKRSCILLECLFSNMVEMHQWLVLKPILHQFEDHIFTSLIQFLYIIGTCPQGPA
jgi:hypothetical protein